MVLSTTRTRRCWVHKSANVLNHVARSMHADKQRLHDIWMAPTKENAGRNFDHLVNVDQAKYLEAVECLTNDRDALLSFHEFPADHWQHLRTNNPIESNFHGVRFVAGIKKLAARADQHSIDNS